MGHPIQEPFAEWVPARPEATLARPPFCAG